MKIWVALSLLIASLSQTLTKITRINQYLTEAQEAYYRKDFSTAIYFYKFLNDSLQVRDRAVRLNLAHAYFQQKKIGPALQYYQPLLTKTPARMSSLVNLQLGVISISKDKSQALHYFKQALIQNPLNEEARFNYEYLKKYLAAHPEEEDAGLPPARPEQAKSEKAKQKKETPNTGKKENNEGSNHQEMPDPTTPDPENPPQPNANQNSPETEENSANANAPDDAANQQREEKIGTLPGTTRGLNYQAGSGNDHPISKGGREEKEEGDKNSQTTYEKLRKANITPEKAKMLLDAMREAEAQYLQQIPRKSTRKMDTSTPNW